MKNGLQIWILSIDIYAKIQNFKSVAAMQLFFMAIMLFSVKNIGLSYITKTPQILI